MVADGCGSIAARYPFIRDTESQTETITGEKDS